MTITIDEFERNLKKYMKHAIDEDIFISEYNGKNLFRFSNETKMEQLRNLVDEAVKNEVVYH
jgi:hypothetical protein